MLIDSHCHLDRLKFATDANAEDYAKHLAACLGMARDRGVSQFLCVGISLKNLPAVVDIAERYHDVVASVGVHPLDVGSGLASIEQLVRWADHAKVVAVGETGLDYYYSEDSRELQQQSFITHLQAASQAKLPTIVHTRDAREDTLALIREYGDTSVAGVLHCFTEDWDMARRAMDMNYLISISGIVTFGNAEALRDVVRQLPLDRLLVETDSPYLAPAPYRGNPNQPQYVREVAEFIAELKGISFAELAQVTSDNFYRLFPRAKPPVSSSLP